MSARPLPIPINPALLKQADERRQHLENRIADQITRFAGSMLFVYLHILWFSVWILSGVEHYPYGLLTMIVSLEAIFLSTFVMISQNRADEKRQVLADHQWQTVQEEEQQNEELLHISNHPGAHQGHPRHRQPPLAHRPGRHLAAPATGPNPGMEVGQRSGGSASTAPDHTGRHRQHKQTEGDRDDHRGVRRTGR